MARKSDFLNIIEKQRNKKKRKKFEGTFIDYLNHLQDNPKLIKLAHKRLYDTVIKQGVNTIDVGTDGYRDIFIGDKIRAYD